MSIAFFMLSSNIENLMRCGLATECTAISNIPVAQCPLESHLNCMAVFLWDDSHIPCPHYFWHRYHGIDDLDSIGIFQSEHWSQFAQPELYFHYHHRSQVGWHPELAIQPPPRPLWVRQLCLAMAPVSVYYLNNMRKCDDRHTYSCSIHQQCRGECDGLLCMSYVHRDSDKSARHVQLNHAHMIFWHATQAVLLAMPTTMESSRTPWIRTSAMYLRNSYFFCN